MVGQCNHNPKPQGLGVTTNLNCWGLVIIDKYLHFRRQKEPLFPQSWFCKHNFLIYLCVCQAAKWGKESRGHSRNHLRRITCAAASVKPQRALEAVEIASPNSGRFPFLAFWEMPVMASPST